MQQPSRRWIALGLSLCCAFALPAGAQPGNRPLQLVVPYGPGNGLDLLAREFADVLRSQTGGTVVVENREGAAGVVGTTYVARAVADGGTLLFTAHPPFASAPWAQPSPPYDPAGSFVPVARLGAVSLVLITSSRTPVASLAQLKTFIAAHPDQATYAHSGNGSPGQIYTELIKQVATLPTLRPIPYKSTGQALTDVISATVLVSLVSYPAAQSHVKSGTVKLLAVGSAQRLPDQPDVPTLAEALGQPGFEAGVWYGVLAPAGTPAERVNQLHAAFAKAEAATSINAFMARSNIVPRLLGPREFATALKQDVDVARQLVKTAPNE
ncbi:MAG: tripartite tricarboxylate transporter substrate binding protein [Burkholderiales bacterium]